MSVESVAGGAGVILGPNEQIEASSLSPVQKVGKLLDELHRHNADFIRMRNDSWQAVEHFSAMREQDKRRQVADLEDDVEYAITSSKVKAELRRTLSALYSRFEIPEGANTAMPPELAEHSRRLGWDPEEKNHRIWMRASLRRAQRHGQLHTDDLPAQLEKEMGLRVQGDPQWPAIVAYSRHEFLMSQLWKKRLKPNAEVEFHEKEALKGLMEETSYRRNSALNQIERIQRVILRDQGMTGTKEEIQFYDKLNRPGVMVAHPLLNRMYGRVTRAKLFLTENTRKDATAGKDSGVALHEARLLRNVLNDLHKDATAFTNAINEDRTLTFETGQHHLRETLKLVRVSAPSVHRLNDRDRMVKRSSAWLM